VRRVMFYCNTQYSSCDNLMCRVICTLTRVTNPVFDLLTYISVSADVVQLTRWYLMVFVETPRWTELQNVQMTSSTEHSRLLSRCGVYTPPITFDDDVTSLTSLQGFPQLTSSSVVPCSIEGSALPAVTGTGFNNDVTLLQAVSQSMMTLGISYSGDEDAWIDRSPASATSLAATQHAAHYPLLVSSAGAMPDSVGVSNEFSSLSYSTFSSCPTFSVFPPSPPDSLSSDSSSFELSVTPLPTPPSYPAQLTSARKTRFYPPETSPPPPYMAQSTTQTLMMEPVLTPRSRRPRLTQPGCRTIRYNRRNQRPDIEQRRTHFCDFPGTSRLLYTTVSQSHACMSAVSQCHVGLHTSVTSQVHLDLMPVCLLVAHYTR